VDDIREAMEAVAKSEKKTFTPEELELRANDEC